MGSPLCGGVLAGLSAVSRRNCETSGFEAAAAQTANYAFDVHIESGLLSVNSATLLQEYFIAPLWIGLVWVAHVMVIAFEWCFTLNLFDTSLLEAVAAVLHKTWTAFTQPWLVAALAIASVLSLYNGIVRRRIAETLAQSLLMVVMMAGAAWMIANPAGTVGVLASWSDQASLGVLGAVVEGTPRHAPRTLADSMRALFESVVGEPWCYLEFGDVQWCADPRRLSPSLHNAGLRLALAERALTRCDLRGLFPKLCTAPGSPQGRAYLQSARLLGEAHTNGDLFLALPANQGSRNSIHDSGSLLSVLCGAEDLSACKGSTAEMAEFRTQAGTNPRFEGIVLIAIGALGMVMLLGFIAMHLLGAGVIGLFYLLLSPLAVLAPAFGERGRACFHSWAIRLLGCLTSKLLYSFLLGVVLLMTRLLVGVGELGWWSRWLLLTTLWWGAFRARNQVLAPVLVGGRGQSEGGRRSGRGLPRTPLARRDLVAVAGSIRRHRPQALPSPVNTRAFLPKLQGLARAQASESPTGGQLDVPPPPPPDRPKAYTGLRRPRPKAVDVSPVMRDVAEYLEGKKSHLGHPLNEEQEPPVDQR